MHSYVLSAAAMPSLLTPLIGGGLALAGVVVSQVITVLLQRQARRSATRAQVETATAEMLAAVFDFQRALMVHHSQWNRWRPRLIRVGLMALEVVAAQAAGSYKDGVVRGGRIAMDWDDQEAVATANLLGGPVGRVTAAIGRAALLPDLTIVAAVQEVNDAVFAAAKGYADGSLYRKKAAAAIHSAADAELLGALENLVVVVREFLHPVPWWRRVGLRRQLAERKAIR